VDDPLRAGAAEARERKGRRAEALADVAGWVHAQEKEGHAARPVPLQGGKPVACLLEGNAEARGHRLHVVAQFAHRGEKGVVGHQHRRGEVVQQADAQHHPGLGGRGLGRGHHRLHRVARLHQHELEGELEAAALARQAVGQVEAARRRVVAAERARQRAERHRHAVVASQPLGDREVQLRRPGADLAPDRLRRGFQLGEMVGAVVEEVAHLLRRQQDARAGGKRDAA
jgi:hypothetical protein